LTEQRVDPATIKQQQRKDWGDAAPNWRKNYDRLRQVSAPVTNRLLELAAVRPGHRVLDIASGSGEPAIPAAKLVGAAGFVFATDMSAEMLEVARDNAAEQGVHNIEFRLVDGEELNVDPGTFDAATCRWGIMFMPEPLRCLQQVHSALKAGACTAFAVWGPPDRNPWVSLPMVIARKYYEGPPLPDPTAVGGMFSFADKAKLQFIFEQAGFQNVRMEEMDIPMSVFDTGREFWAYTRELAGPFRRILDGMPPDVQEKIGDEIATAAGGGDPNGKVSLKGNPIIGSGLK
jgi:ubiquinone/menaquinone biosynthesis C-methylase UbiE